MNPPLDVSTRPEAPADLDDPRLLAALEEYQAALDAGQRPERAAFLARYADIADALAECLDGLALVRSAAPDLSPPPVTVGTASVLGDFRLVRPIGRGGMGVVYEAEQISLKRSVAVKLLTGAALLDDRRRLRFEIEAAAAARLRHPHVVAVHAVGCDNGVPYYAMPLVDGTTLGAVVEHLRQQRGSEARQAEPTRTEPTRPPGATVRRGSTDLGSATSAPPPADRLGQALAASGLDRPGADFARAAATLLADAADGLHHAHECGIVHRDVKPSNLLLDTHGSVFVADFGLARVVADDRNLTRTGELVGTLRYLSPEQAKGLPADHRSDVHGLGVTLYELLTREPPFPATNRAALLLQIGDDDPPPPRRLERTVPRDLETVVLKALAKEPNDRYATAADFAADLRRFLDGQPVRAGRPSVVDRASRWLFRHRIVAAVALVGALLTTAVSVVGFVRVAHFRRAEEARARELRTFVDRMNVRLTDRWLSRQPHLEPVQREVLEEILAYYEEFLRRWNDDASVRVEAGQAYRRVGDLRARLGHDGAAEAYDRAVQLLQGETEPPTRFAYAAALNNRGNFRRVAGHLDTAADDYQQARAVFADLVGDKADLDYLDGLGGSTLNQGVVLHLQSRYVDAATALTDARTIFRRLTAAAPDVPAYQHDLAAAESNLANLFRDTERFAEAESLYRTALSRQQNLLHAHPTEPAFRHAHGTTRFGLGLLLKAMKRIDEAREELRAAEVVRARLAADFPSVPSYRDDLVAVRRALAP